MTHRIEGLKLDLSGVPSTIDEPMVGLRSMGPITITADWRPTPLEQLEAAARTGAAIEMTVEEYPVRCTVRKLADGEFEFTPMAATGMRGKP